MSKCINWRGKPTQAGYGRTTFRGRRFLVHRRAWIIANGEIPEGLCVCHKCDNRLCINPDHLFIGTHKDNAQDCKRKGRLADKSGTNNGQAKINHAIALSIRSRHAAGATQLSFCREYGLSKKAVWNIVRWKSWRIK